MDIVALATSAAPTFFPPVELETKLFMDGGILQNNPAIPCILKSFDRKYPRDNIFMLSLGTGDTPHQPKPPDLASSLFSLWSHLTQPDFETETIVRDMLSFGAYHRLQYHFKDEAPQLDDNKLETVQFLEEKGIELVEESEDTLRSICKILSSESI